MGLEETQKHQRFAGRRQEVLSINPLLKKRF